MKHKKKIKKLRIRIADYEKNHAHDRGYRRQGSLNK